MTRPDPTDPDSRAGAGAAPAPPHRAPVRLLLLPALLTATFAACSGPQSALDPAGPSARWIGTLTWILTGISAAVTVIVIGLVLASLRRKRPEHHTVTPPLRASPLAERLQRLRRTGARRDPEGEAPAEALRRTRSDSGPLPVRLDTADTDRRAVRGLTVLAVAIPLVLVTASFVYTLVVHRRLALADLQGRMTIEVVGRQWWWEVNYLDAGGTKVFSTANEIHIPAGVPVRFRLRAGDVIHSFWVPRLGGKVDMIPGRTNWLTLEADDPGTYRGQCAEYCDGPHAHMSFLVVAREEAEFQAWARRQAGPAAPPPDSLAAAGRDVFLRSACVTCHAVRGTPAQGTLGPDLTHLANRTTLLAAMVPNNRGHLGGLIGSPRSVKPGIHMPAVPLASDELVALIRYLETLH